MAESNNGNGGKILQWIVPWIITSLFGVVTTFGGFAFSRWADVLDKARLDLVVVLQTLELVKAQAGKNAKIILDMQEQMKILQYNLPPSPTRDRIEAMEEYLHDKSGFKPPTRKWQ